MAQPATSIVDEGRERINTARERLDSEFKKAQKDLKTRRKNLEKQLAKNRKSFEKEFAKNRKSFEKQTNKLRKDLEKNGLVKQLNRWRNDAEEQFEDLFGNVLGTLQIASQADVKKIDRRLAKISKQLKDLEAKKTSRTTEKTTKSRATA